MNDRDKESQQQHWVEKRAGDSRAQITVSGASAERRIYMLKFVVFVVLRIRSTSRSAKIAGLFCWECGDT
jgi:hypothetical protein